MGPPSLPAGWHLQLLVDKAVLLIGVGSALTCLFLSINSRILAHLVKYFTYVLLVGPDPAQVEGGLNKCPKEVIESEG